MSSIFFFCDKNINSKKYQILPKISNICLLPVLIRKYKATEAKFKVSQVPLLFLILSIATWHERRFCTHPNSYAGFQFHKFECLKSLRGKSVFGKKLSLSVDASGSKCRSMHSKFLQNM